MKDDYSVVEMTGEVDLLVSCARVMGPAFAPFAQALFSKSLGIWENMITILLSASIAGEEEQSQLSEPIVLAIDIIVALAEGLGSLFGNLLAQGRSSETIFELMVHSCDIVDIEPRVAVFSLMGELAKNGIGGQGGLGPLAVKVLPKVAAEIQYNDNEYEPWAGDRGQGALCNNAIWVLGEMSKRVDPQIILPFADRILEPMARIVTDEKGIMPDNIRANAATVFGRLIVCCRIPQLLNVIVQIFPQWCLRLSELPDDEEKTDAFKGLVTVLTAQPHVAVGDLRNWLFLCKAMISWEMAEDGSLEMPVELRNEIVGVIRAIQSRVGESQWNSLCEQTIAQPNGQKFLSEMRGRGFM